jgi:hypothetical protein
MLRKHLLAALIATSTAVAAMAAMPGKAAAGTHVGIYVGVGVPAPGYWYAGPWWSAPVVVYYPVPYYVPVNYRAPRVYHRPRWRTRCWTRKRIVRKWNGHRWVKKVVRKRSCRRVRVW